jgi:hypothetical protein
METDMSKTFKLKTPLTVVGKNGPEPRNEIELREPTADDLFDLGVPFTVVRDGDKIELRHDHAALKKWLPRLAGLSAGEFGALPASAIIPMAAWLNALLTDAGNSD